MSRLGRAVLAAKLMGSSAEKAALKAANVAGKIDRGMDKVDRGMTRVERGVDNFRKDLHKQFYEGRPRAPDKAQHRKKRQWNPITGYD